MYPLFNHPLVDLIEVVRIKIKIKTLNAEVCLSTDLAKSCAVSALVLAVFSIKSESRIIALTLWFEEVFDLHATRLSVASF